MKLATLALIDTGERVLFGEKKRGEIGTGKRNGPGGKLEPGETLLECIVREAREELKIELDPAALTHVAVVTFFSAGEPDFKVHVYWTDTFTGEPTETVHMIPHWHERKNLPFHLMHDGDWTWLPTALNQEKFNAHVYFSGRAEGWIDTQFFDYDPTL